MKFPNMATTVADLYFSSSTHDIINNIDWVFIESELIDAKQKAHKPDNAD